MKFCDKKIQDHLLAGGKVKRPSFWKPIYSNRFNLVFQDNDNVEKVYWLDREDLTADDWEIVVDFYDDFITNRFLCFFWNENEPYDIGYLKSYNNYKDYPFYGEVLRNGCTSTSYYQHCKPVEGKKFNILP